MCTIVKLALINIVNIMFLHREYTHAMFALICVWIVEQGGTISFAKYSPRTVYGVYWPEMGILLF